MKKNIIEYIAHSYILNLRNKYNVNGFHLYFGFNNIIMQNGV